ncbi:hypothetical protein C1631_022830 [Chryseobacterium phosphatilyticum]|uniref:Uncharacterized protein n=1 Tax=Chryseobacterium phosphatilyticum TaxID=475075 RepID=A0A316WPT5_9FLAO|nr:hypothetical protein [Chryseobacterium phosphatilyticum]PWN62403.1 hypothetical protein C1631_022830 [Chryseobacterium phosphatilyticum]
MKKINMKPYFVIFEITKIKGTLNEGSTIEEGERFVGTYHPEKNSVFFEDENNQEWWFKVGESCDIITDC